MATINCKVDELGGIYCGDAAEVGEYATLRDAARGVLERVIDGVRGVGTMTINHDGKVYALADYFIDDGKPLNKTHWQAIEYRDDGTIGHVIDLGIL